MMNALDSADHCLSCGKRLVHEDGEDAEICRKCWEEFYADEHDGSDGAE